MQPRLHTGSVQAKCDASLCFQNSDTKVNDLFSLYMSYPNREKLVILMSLIRLSYIGIAATQCRYLSVKWGIELSKMVVFVGEKGDTDIEDLLAGHPKTLVLKGSVEYGSEELLRGEDGYKREDAVPSDSPNIAYSEGFEAHDISAALEAFGVK